MSTIVLPLTLLGIATGIAIAQAPSRTRAIAFIVFAALCSIVATLPPAAASERAAVACWIAIAACAAAIHWVRAPRHLALALAGASGACAGALAAAAGVRPELRVLPPALAVLLLAAWCLRHGARAAVQVVASWLIAVVLLVASVHDLHVTPGDQPDHLQ